jgi:hypothetical protein
VQPTKAAPASIHSSTISLSDLYLFGKVKNALIRVEISDEIDFLKAVAEILNGFSDAELQRVFRSRIEPTEKVSDAGGDYLTSHIFSSSLSYSGLTPVWRV